MQGDYSRLTFDPAKRYSTVRLQQGRVLLDSDWNESQDIDTYLDRAAYTDIIGRHGAPNDNDAFAPQLLGGDVGLSAGHYYVDGILCENDAAITVGAQPDLPGYPLPDAAGNYLAYLDVWERHITALEDPDIKEEALGGPDTTTRTQVVWQVKYEPLGADIDAIDPDAEFPSGWQPSGTASTGTLIARTNPVGAPPDKGTYRRLENQLYRVEIHTPNVDDTPATFKWSRDNGAVSALVDPLVGINGSEILLAEFGAGLDERLRFAPGQWVEISNEARLLYGQPGELVEVREVNDRVLTVEWPGGAAPDDLVDELIVRRWDSQGTLQVLTGGFINLEDGIQVGFDEGDYRTGDYWLIPARTIRADVIWPLDPDTDEEEFVPRHGTIHHYAPLFLLRFDGGSFTDVIDIRRLFPPLTNIRASDVYFDNSDVCDLINANTVQEAIIALCQRDLNSCTFVVNSLEGWHMVFEAIDGNASVCFPVGDFRVDEPIVVSGKGNLKINGSGLGSRILAPKSEAAFIFEDCESVTISDLYIEVGAAGSRGQSEHLNGALTFRNCGSVTVEEVTIKGAAGTSRAASCITVEQRESADVTGSVRIRHCDLAMGHQQTGILLLNVTRAQIEDNSMYVSPKPGRLSFDAMLRDPDYRGILRKMLISNVSVGADAPPVPPGRPAPNVALVKNGQSIRFVASDSNLAGRWKTLAANLLMPESANTPRRIMAFFEDVADNILLNDGNYTLNDQNLTTFRTWFDSLKLNNPAIAYQGISVGGRIAKDIRIQNNSIRGVLQGIHIGVSRRGPRNQAPESAENIIIASNTIGVSLPPEAAVRERHGIFVGNCASLLIADNYITARRFGLAPTVRIDGIRVFGYLGRMMIVRQNHMVGFNVGIQVEPLGDISASQQWLVSDNMAVSAQQVVKVAARATAKVKVPNNLA